MINEDNVNISEHTSNNINDYRYIDFDYVITVCENTKERFPFSPAKAVVSEEEIAEQFRKVRDQIKEYCKHFVKKHILPK